MEWQKEGGGAYGPWDDNGDTIPGNFVKGHMHDSSFASSSTAPGKPKPTDPRKMSQRTAAKRGEGGVGGCRGAERTGSCDKQIR